MPFVAKVKEKNLKAQRADACNQSGGTQKLLLSFAWIKRNALLSLGGMTDLIYIPPSCQTAEKHLSFAFKKGLVALSKKEFVRGWCSLSFLFPGLHPDGFASRGSGWPKHFKPFAEEAWRRFQAGELTDNELYCYQAAKARITLEREATRQKTPWCSSDHFAV